ncbi:MAG: hypothetical protein IJ245_02570, partial [Lachnospiraceae bacterium]|nr:hypothetical protein [Lachnospiraceae bacterium]
NNKLNDKIKLVLNLYHLCDENDTNVPLLNKTYTHNVRGNLIQKITGFNKLIIPNFFLDGGNIPQENKKAGTGDNGRHCGMLRD